jgi:hypothetical protein
VPPSLHFWHYGDSADNYGSSGHTLIDIIRAYKPVLAIIDSLSAWNPTIEVKNSFATQAPSKNSAWSYATQGPPMSVSIT